MRNSVRRDLIDFAHTLANAASAIVQAAAPSRWAVHQKADASPVTEIDRAVEKRLRALIAAHHPEHHVIGEEFNDDQREAEYVWVLDPIDGTTAFIAALPIYSTLIGLTRGGYPILGVVEQPITRERWIGIDGDGTYYNGARIHTDACERLSDALVCTTSPAYYENADAHSYRRIVSESRQMVYGGNGYAFAQIARGFVDVAIETGVGVHDYCALVPIVENAGGVMTDWRGERLTLDPVRGGRILASGNRILHQAAMDCLAGPG